MPDRSGSDCTVQAMTCLSLPSSSALSVPLRERAEDPPASSPVLYVPLLRMERLPCLKPKMLRSAPTLNSLNHDGLLISTQGGHSCPPSLRNPLSNKQRITSKKTSQQTASLF